jgi:hypothetical protein
MENVEIWLTPLILLPGVAMLVLSTSVRYARIHDEFHAALHGDAPHESSVLDRLIHRATLFRNALVCLYASVVLFTSASLAGALIALWAELPVQAVVLTLASIGILGVVAAAGLLVRESFESLEVIRDHAAEIVRQKLETATAVGTTPAATIGPPGDLE